MHNKRIWRVVLLAFMAAMTAIYAVTAYKNEQNLCMGIKILSLSEEKKYTDFSNVDLSNMFFHNDEMAAVDINSKTIFISQNISSDTKYNQLIGKLKFQNPNVKLYFAYDEYFDKLAAAVEESHPFKLIADFGDYFAEYKVVFTTLPIIRLTGAESYVNDENRQVYSGEVCVWAPNDLQTNSYTVKKSDSEWYVRGDSQKAQPKKPYKLSLKKPNGKNNNVNLLGLGSDDDWILNSMSLEDLNFRDKFVMDLWNEMCKNTDYNYKMDSAEYVEVVNNGVYSGIYLLQRRIDAKYLNLDKNTVLLKGRKEFIDPNNPQYYTPVGSAVMPQKATEIMELYDKQEYCENIDLKNWIDVNLFIDWGVMIDNVRRHNMYYVLEDINNSPKMRFILWDTDMTFGLSWGDNRYIYDPWTVYYSKFYRSEYEKLKSIYPNLDILMAQRWNELRQNVLSEDNVMDLVFEYQNLFKTSGAFERDKLKWGSFHQGKDNVDAFYGFITNRFDIMDKYYEEILEGENL